MTILPIIQVIKCPANDGSWIRVDFCRTCVYNICVDEHNVVKCKYDVGVD